LSAIPFTYIMWSLFGGLSKSIDSQPDNVRGLIKQARLLTFASWGFYPIVYMIPYTSLAGSTTEVAVQLGYTLADIIAKAGLGILIYNIAVRKSEAEADGEGAPVRGIYPSAGAVVPAGEPYIAGLHIAATGAALILAAAGVNLAGGATTILWCAVILVLGLPHGALDMASLLAARSTVGAFGAYLAVAGAMAALWWVVPGSALMAPLWRFWRRPCCSTAARSMPCSRSSPDQARFRLCPIHWCSSRPSQWPQD
jgi:hypothetical protein